MASGHKEGSDLLCNPEDIVTRTSSSGYQFGTPWLTAGANRYRQPQKEPNAEPSAITAARAMIGPAIATMTMSK